MTKERIILALVAIIAGLIVASSIFFFYKGQDKTSPTRISPTPQASQNGKVTLNISQPEHESITDEKTAVVTGTATPNALIIITTDLLDIAVSASENGAFEQEITLSENENIITVTSYPENGISETQEILVTYTLEEF